jgi:predicted secreted protein
VTKTPHIRLRVSAILWLLVGPAQLFAQSNVAEDRSFIPVAGNAIQESSASPSAKETVIVNRKFNNREIKVRAGGMIRVELEELGAAGYVWTLQNLDKNHFEILKTHTDESRPQNDVTGAPVTRTWLIRAKTGGKSELRFIHSRPWEDEKNASETFVLKVLIIPQSSTR